MSTDLYQTIKENNLKVTDHQRLNPSNVIINPQESIVDGISRRNQDYWNISDSLHQNSFNNNFNLDSIRRNTDSVSNYPNNGYHHRKKFTNAIEHPASKVLPLPKFDSLDKSNDSLDGSSVVTTTVISQFDEQEETNSGEEVNKSILVPCVAVYTSNYNFSVLAIVMYILKQDVIYGEFAKSHWYDSAIKIQAYVGACVGQFIMGYLGDVVGRKKGMIITIILSIIGAIGSAIFSWGDAASSLILIGVFRFILGVGSGGVYPLSAVTAAEGTASSCAENRSPRVSWAYFFNVPGIVTPYLLAAITWNISRDADFNFRILLMFGAIPVFLILYNAFKIEDSEEFKRSKGSRKNIFPKIKQYYKLFIGTGVCWFLYDVAAYGILLTQPDITAKIWGSATTVNDVIWRGLLFNLIGAPSTLMGILVVKQMGLKWLQFWGFIGLALSCGLMVIMSVLVPDDKTTLMILLAVINYFINWGAAITTFVLPSIIFPPECRSTFNGICAAMGKIGAGIGIFACIILLRSAGIAPLMGVAALASLLGAILTWFYVGQVPKTLRSSITQSFGSLLSCIPFCDLRNITRN